MRCAICSRDTNRLFQANQTWIRECPACQYRFAEIAADRQHVEAVYGQEYFFGGGAGYADYLSEEPILVEHGRYYARTLAKYCAPGRLLDVGAAAGFLMQGFRELGWHVKGVEPNAAMAALAAERFGHEVHVGSLEDVEVRETFDLVTLIQVVPHFWDLRRAFFHAAELTSPGGHWLIETWNYRSWTARLFGKRWHEYSPPSVLHWFTPHSLELVARQFGLERVAIGKPVKRLNGSHARSLLQYRLEQLGLAKLRPLVKVIPQRARIRYPADDLFWMLLKKP